MVMVGFLYAGYQCLTMERNKMSMKKVAKILRDITTTVAEHLGQPAGIMFDMAAINDLEKLEEEE